MTRFGRGLLSIVFIMTSSASYALNIGLLVVATGRYIKFVQPLIESADKFFCKNHSVTYFVFTEGEVPNRPDVIKIEQHRLGWPYDTLMRSAMYAKAYDLWKDMDYVFASDVDMLFVDTVGDEILSDRVATQHPGYVGQRGTYETNPISRACVRSNEGTHYFAGGFYGGSAAEMFKVVSTMTATIADDLKRGFIAVWHDESHWNRYCIDYKPTKMLSPSYCFPGPGYPGVLPKCPRKLIALTKNHNEVRQ